ncbi:hypothetical protein NLU14_01700 [Marinobacter sp. 71-i]|uniref:YcgL domain-containing protein n=1 Tax=Marinobacter iranensis TaxID=2962607 RepID=A0ABT5Y5J4_9GAMM|nr:hypothetical protein [Marinobacter iranensis]MDF0748941.1 hypothetical protein [Marinobacter iranensis]
MSHHFVVCTKNTGYEASLEPRKLYEVVEDSTTDELGMIRVIDESGESYLYPKDFFLSIPLPESIEEQIAHFA